MDHGLNALRIGADDGDEDCSVLLGYAISPLVPGVDFPKDGKLAYALFSQFPDNARAQYERGKLLIEGIGCEKNAELGAELIAKARAVDSVLDAYESRTVHTQNENTAENGSFWTGWGVAAAATIAVGVAAAAFAFMRRSRQ
jgi:hypothetical protein